MANQPSISSPDFLPAQSVVRPPLDILISASNEMQARAMEVARLDSQSKEEDGDDYFHNELKTAIETLATINEMIVKVCARGG